jgi:hypothetical protein
VRRQVARGRGGAGQGVSDAAASGVRHEAAGHGSGMGIGDSSVGADSRGSGIELILLHCRHFVPAMSCLTGNLVFHVSNSGVAFAAGNVVDFLPGGRGASSGVSSGRGVAISGATSTPR